MQLELFKSSWATNEGFETLRNQLDDLVPLSGRCKNPRSTNKKLESAVTNTTNVSDAFDDLFNK